MTGAYRIYGKQKHPNSDYHKPKRACLRCNSILLADTSCPQCGPLTMGARPEAPPHALIELFSGEITACECGYLHCECPAQQARKAVDERFVVLRDFVGLFGGRWRPSGTHYEVEIEGEPHILLKTLTPDELKEKLHEFRDAMLCQKDPEKVAAGGELPPPVKTGFDHSFFNHLEREFLGLYRKGITDIAELRLSDSLWERLECCKALCFDLGGVDRWSVLLTYGPQHSEDVYQWVTEHACLERVYPRVREETMPMIRRVCRESGVDWRRMRNDEVTEGEWYELKYRGGTWKMRVDLGRPVSILEETLRDVIDGAEQRWDNPKDESPAPKDAFVAYLKGDLPRILRENRRLPKELHVSGDLWKLLGGIDAIPFSLGRVYSPTYIPVVCEELKPDGGYAWRSDGYILVGSYRGTPSTPQQELSDEIKGLLA